MNPRLRPILLVDDSPRDRELVIDALESHHLANTVVAVRDGAEALDYLHARGEFANRPDPLPAVILLDLKMPKLDGLDVLRELKSTPELKLLPVVMMTSSREEQDLVNSYQLGVNAYVIKPVNFQEFVEAVKQIGAFWGLLNELPPVPVGCGPKG
ncbi:MAG TPA: response regulator [Prosthecobacter sp.]|nr:response regulator [Prosthecobacter sp.]